MSTTTITNYSYFFNSADIKVFPCQNRGLIYNNENTSIGINDPEARMLSEYNFAHTTTDYMQSYAITKGNFDNIAKGEETFCFVIGGYYFELKFTDTDESSEINTRKEMLKLYFHIRLRSVDIKETNAEPGRTRTSQELAPIVDKDGEVLLTSLDYNNIFYGIGLSSSGTSSLSTYAVKFFDDNGNFIFTTLRPELSHGEQDNSTKIGSNLIASKTNQTVIGEYNTSNTEAVFIVGNGIADKKNNSIEVKPGALQINNEANNITGETNTIIGTTTNTLQAATNNITGTTNTIAATDKNIIKLTETNYIDQNASLVTIKNTNIKLDGMIEITDNAKINAGKNLEVDTIKSNTSSEQLNIGNKNDIQINSSGITCVTPVKMNNLTFNYQKDGTSSTTGISFSFKDDSSITKDTVTEQPLFYASSKSAGAKLSYLVPTENPGILRLKLTDDSNIAFKLTTLINDNYKDIISVNGKNGCEIFRGLKVYKNDESTELISATEDDVILCTGAKVGKYQIAAIEDPEQNGSIYATKFYAKSDIKLKENIEDTKFDAESILDKIKIRDFTWKADEQHKQQVGVIAQELAEVIPEEIKDCFVDTTSETFSISESKLVYLLIKAYQEEKAKRIEIENRLNKLEGRN